MKMVLVFDTDDRDGCKSSLKIMKQLSKDYNFDGIMGSMDDPRFGKIEFIKMLRDFEAFMDIQKNKGRDTTALRSFKEFADYVFKTKRETSYITKWKAPR